MTTTAVSLFCSYLAHPVWIASYHTHSSLLICHWLRQPDCQSHSRGQPTCLLPPIFLYCKNPCFACYCLDSCSEKPLAFTYPCHVWLSITVWPPKNVISNNVLLHLTSTCVVYCVLTCKPNCPLFLFNFRAHRLFPLSQSVIIPIAFTGAVRVFTQLTLKSLLFHFSDYSMFPISPSLCLLLSLCLPPSLKKKIRPSMGDSSTPQGPDKLLLHYFQWPIFACSGKHRSHPKVF